MPRKVLISAPPRDGLFHHLQPLCFASSYTGASFVHVCDCVAFFLSVVCTQYKQAVEHYQLAISINPMYPDVWYAMGTYSIDTQPIAC